MAELIERELLCHSLNQHLRQGLCKGDEKMDCAMTGLNPYSFMKGFEYGMQLAQTIVCNRPTTTEAEIRARAFADFVEHITLPLTTEEDIAKILEQLKEEQ